jgi:transcriptional regulator with XRE-family HTH domain
MANQEDTSAFADRVRELREDLGLSLQRVGAAVEVATETIRRWETGLSAPLSREHVDRLEQVLGARPGELWALLKGREIPNGDDTDPDVLAHLVHEFRELKGVVSDLVEELEQRRRENGEPRGARRGSAPREPVRQAS